MDISQILLLIGMIAIGWLVFRIPSSYINAYVGWVHKKHGVMIGYSIWFLLMVTGIGIFTMLTKPGENPIMEIISCIIVAVISGIIAWDNFNFWRTEYRQHQ